MASRSGRQSGEPLSGNDASLADRVKQLRRKHSRPPDWPFPPPRLRDPDGPAEPPRIDTLSDADG